MSTFKEQIESMKREKEQTRIDAEATAKRTQDEKDTVDAVRALFLTNPDKLPTGRVIAVESNTRITVQLEASLDVKYPKIVEDNGTMIVGCVQTLSIVDNKPVYSNVVDVKVGMTGLVDTMSFGNQYRLILDNRNDEK